MITTPEDYKPTMCPICRKLFATETEMIIHYESHRQLNTTGPPEAPPPLPSTEESIWGMPLGKYATFGECVGAQKRKGHSDESARKICGAMERDLGAGEGSSSKLTMDTEGNIMSEQQAPPQEESKNVSFSEGEITAVTQGLTVALDFATQANAPPEVVKAITEANEIVYSKVDVKQEEA